MKTDAPADKIKHDLNLMAKSSPHAIINASTDKRAQVKILAREALDAQIIFFDRINSLYYFGVTKKEICKVKLGDDQFETLVSTLMDKPGAFREVDKKLKS